jgi:secondary thiamine-phosphate synthase enzyme
MKITQKKFSLKAKPRGYHLVTDEIIQNIPELRDITKGVIHLFICHTSAGLTINENADPDVRKDFSTFFDSLAPEDVSLYRHTAEGPDDMTSHIKTSIMGNSVTLPLSNGRFNIGIWQGIYLCEHRNHGGSRQIVATIFGE